MHGGCPAAHFPGARGSQAVGLASRIGGDEFSIGMGGGGGGDDPVEDRAAAVARARPAQSPADVGQLAAAARSGRQAASTPMSLRIPTLWQE
jgi:hypothetical protein